MSLKHCCASIVVALIALAILSGMLFGKNQHFWFGVNDVQDFRAICIGLWIALFPLWWTFEEMIWMPPAGEARDNFIQGQKIAKFAWTAAGVAIGIIVGADLSSARMDSTKPGATAQTGTQSEQTVPNPR